jgi:hypothetical protein
MLFTAYELPFTVHYPAAGFFSRGEDVRISLRLREGATDEIRQAITHRFSLFQALANCGGLCGKSIDPVASGVVAVNSLGSSKDRAAYELRLCKIDDRSLVTLVDLLLHRDVSPFVAAIQVDGLPPTNKLGTDFKQLFTVHPERYSPLPFAVRDEQPETGAIVVELTLRRALEPAGRDAPHSWCRVVFLWLRYGPTKHTSSPTAPSWISITQSSGHSSSSVPTRPRWIRCSTSWAAFRFGKRWWRWRLLEGLAADGGSVQLANAILDGSGLHRRSTPEAPSATPWSDPCSPTRLRAARARTSRTLRSTSRYRDLCQLNRAAIARTRGFG